MKSVFLFVGFIFFLALSSCKKDEMEMPADMGTNYFPFSVGNWIEYEVDSIAYIQLPTIDTLYKKLRVKFVMDSLFTDAEGRPTMRWLRYRKDLQSNLPADSLEWILFDVWTCTKTNTFIETFEENIPFVKLIFPVSKNKEWNGNAKNSLGAENYTYSEVDQNENLGFYNFDSVLTVTQKFTSSAIAYQSKIEKYARNVGMIYKEYIDVTSQSVTVLPVMNRIEQGIVYRMKLVAYEVVP